MSNLGINLDRLMARLDALGQIGAIEGGGVCRLALSEADRLGRDQVVAWMRDLGLDIQIDQIGNVVGVRAGRSAGAPVTAGSHIDTVATGGRYDGNLGVLAGLEVVATLNDAGIETERPLAVGFFTNEEGARFAPDMMGSGVQQGALNLAEMLQSTDRDGDTVAAALQRIGYAGDAPEHPFRAHCYLELHVEQGPVLEREDYAIGAVEGVQGISWTEYRFRGCANHAGTTPMHLRQDAGLVACAVAVEARRMALEMGAAQVATVGSVRFEPDLVNVIPKQASLTLDLRNTEEALLQEAEAHMRDFVQRTAGKEGVEFESSRLARFEPVHFDAAMVDSVAAHASALGHRVKRMPSGAGHDAQMFAPNCPTAMIFVPSRGGISHNVAEFTAPEQIRAGADVLLRIMLEQAG